MLLLDPQQRRRNLRWLIGCLVITGCAIAVYGWYAVRTPRWPGGSSPPGLLFGILGGLIILFEFALWPRKSKYVRAWRLLGRTQHWMRAHIWLGLLSVPLVLMHTGFLWGGWLSTTFAVLYILVILSGIYGLVMQYIIPRMLLHQIPAETIYSQIPHVCEMLLEDSDDLIRAACGWDAVPVAHPAAAAVDPTIADINERAAAIAAAAEAAAERDAVAAANFRADSSYFSQTSMFQLVGAVRKVGRFQGMSLQTQVQDVRITGAQLVNEIYREKIRPFLEHGPPANEVLSHADRAREFFDDLRTRLSPDSHHVVAALEGWCSQRREFHLQARLQWWLHGWLAVHLPLSIALVILLFAHVFFALKYW